MCMEKTSAGGKLLWLLLLGLALLWKEWWTWRHAVD